MVTGNRDILKGAVAGTASGKIEAVVRKVLDFARPTLPRIGFLSANICIRKAIDPAQVALRRSETGSSRGCRKRCNARDRAESANWHETFAFSCYN